MGTDKKMKELVIISGKGGTGKTSITASFAVLAAGRAVLADCDVDAADLHLVLTPKILSTHDFISGHEARIVAKNCIQCGLCKRLCRFDAIQLVKNAEGRLCYSIDPVGCEGCGVCFQFCPVKAIEFPDRHCGRWMISETRCGTLVHACLSAAAENSGKLVSTVRREARRLAEEQNLDLLITDGPPGIGCPVIASVTGATQVLVVTEPTVSGEHDLERVLKLTRFFDIPTAICVNKWDINAEMTERIEAKAREAGAQIAGRVRYDPAVTTAQIQAKAVVELDAPSAADIRSLWKTVMVES